jgi:peroxiredoxin
MEDDGLDHVTPGMLLPPIDLPSTDGGFVHLATLTGRSVLAVYPWTGRPRQPNPPHWDDIHGAHGSTPELEGFRDLSEEIARHGARIFALSRQTTDYQQEAVERLRLPFPILSDEHGSFSEAFALPSFTTGGESYLKRLTLMLRDGEVEWVFYPVMDPAGHAGEILAWLKQEA